MNLPSILIGTHSANEFLKNTTDYIQEINRINNANYPFPLDFISGFISDHNSKNKGVRLLCQTPLIHQSNDFISFDFHVHQNKITIDKVVVCGIEVNEQNFVSYRADMNSSLEIINK